MAGEQHHACGDKQFKFILIGDSTTGKTCISTRFTQDSFDKLHRPTVGVDFHVKRISLPGSFNATIQLWDVGGQALSGQMLDKYLYGANAIIFVYDITNLASFENVNNWLKVVHQMFQDEALLPHMSLVGNKNDLEHMRVVKADRHVKMAQDNGMTAHGVSAKTGESVNLCFQKIAGELLGIRLTRSEQENVQPVVKAEIVQNPSAATRSEIQPVNNCKTTVCILQ